MPTSNTLGQLMAAVAGFLQRDLTDFQRIAVPKNSVVQPLVVTNPTGTMSVDLLSQACENARLYAERKIDFELAKVDVDVPGVSLDVGADLSAAVLHTDGTTPVSVKKIITPFLGLADGNMFPVDLMNRKAWNDKVKKRMELSRPTDTEDFAFINEAPFVVVQEGSRVFVAPADVSQFASSFTLFFNVVQWLPTYLLPQPWNLGAFNNVDPAKTDFILQNGFDWLMFYSISQLNFYLKEDARVTLNTSFLTDSWDSLVKWNNELIMSGADSVTDLD